MLTLLINLLKSINDPHVVVMATWFFVVSYYLVSSIFISNFAKKNSAVDIITSVFYCFVAGVLILSLIDLVSRNTLSFTYLFHYYMLLIFLYAIIFNLLEWHFPATFDGLVLGWKGELQCFLLSVQALTGSGYTNLRPVRMAAEILVASENVLGIFFIAIFVAKTVGLMAQPK